jgi:hypothetical protein
MKAKKRLSLALAATLVLTALAFPAAAHEGTDHDTAGSTEVSGGAMPVNAPAGTHDGGDGGMSHSPGTADAATSSDAPDKHAAAADHLHGLGLLHGVGTDAHGRPDLALDRALTRAEAFTLFVRLIGKEEEALGGDYAAPFTDLPAWATPYIGYAHAHGLTTGVSATKFHPEGIVTAPQYLTIILRGLGYRDGADADFEWNKAYALTDRLAITNGEYLAGNAEFTRADAAAASYAALSADFKDGSGSFIRQLVAAGAIDENAAIEAGLSPGTQSAVNAEGFSELIIDYSKLWTSDIAIKVGVPVKWYVYAVPGALPATGMACGKTIRIPGFKNADGVLWTDAYDQENGHITLVEGKNFVYEFTPTEVGDILFTCWMGPDCHVNYIHVTEDGSYTEERDSATEAEESGAIEASSSGMSHDGDARRARGIHLGYAFRNAAR